MKTKNSGRAWQKTIAWIALLAFTTACTSLRPLAMTDEMSWQDQLQAGDEVHVRRKDGSEALLTIERLDAEGISGGGIDVAFVDIDELAVKKTSAVKSAGLGVAILFGVVLIGLLAIDEDDIFPSVAN